MIPATVASEVQRTIIDYLLTTFNFQEETLAQALQKFMTEQLFQGPYLDLRLPFRRAAGDPLPLTITPPFPPYAHQVAAFTRLTSAADHTPEPTLVTTGTGSGKTECFLYPILDHCYRHRREPGIKAIILYPMNALASDQAGRLADLLWRDSRLKGQLTAGIYIGGDNTTLRKSMGPTWLIDDHATLRQSPPDILLTNYKMLDFLLLRPEDKPLWAKNAPTTLRYLVLDELHTYDGAQGADVAGLIRRLKARLAIPAGALCPIGTSATVGGNLPQTLVATGIDEAAADEAAPDSEGESDAVPPLDPLLTFAGAIFGETFLPTSIIREDRYTLAEFLAAPATHFALPAAVTALAEQAGEPYAAYITRLAYGWFGEAVPLRQATADEVTVDPYGLGELLKSHSFLRALLAATRGQVVPRAALCERVAHQDADFAALGNDDQKLILQSFLALIAYARTVGGSSDQPRPAPLLTLQVQLWLRELSGLLRLVQGEPAFAWRTDQPEGALRVPGHARTLPAYYCRECGHSGWLGLRREGDEAITDEPRQLYDAYFNRSRHICYLYLDTPSDQLAATQERLCPGCLKVSYSAHCRTCQQPTLPVVIHKKLSQPRGATRQSQDLQSCPRCQTDFALSIVGAQGATLASVAISHLYTTPLNQDKKLLVFTDSVQDAAHRAAFFSARTYRFNLRTALQSALLAWPGADETNQGGDIALDQLTDHLLTHWRARWQDMAQPHIEQHLVATFLPPDLADRSDYRAYMAAPPTTPIPPDLAADLRTRLSWEVIMEYGFNARIGRSLERVGSSTAYLDPARLDPLLDRLHLTLREEIGFLRNLDRPALRHFVVGFLERTRVRGGIVHPLLKRYVEEQGNWFKLTKGQEPLLSPFHKQSPRFPRFLTEATARGVFDAYLPGSSGRNWYFDWAQRTLSSHLGVPESNDLYRLVLPRLVEGGLLYNDARNQASTYGLAQRALLVTPQTVPLHCTVCNQPQPVAVCEAAAWQGQPCLSYGCRGHYAPAPTATALERHYYQALYNRGQVERIFAQEHTGLLTRADREALEQAFKSRSQADAANLLTATPTLEMGIDIGDLSATMAASVPPTTANYLQRIGRAGRQSGNALIITLAGGRPHDLYFYSEPLALIAAPVTPPGVFLNAPNMLKRHWLAFCLDHWNLSHSLASALPREVKTLLARYRHGGFPAAFLIYYATAKAGLLDRFLQQYQPVITPETVALLQQYAAGDALPQAIKPLPPSKPNVMPCARRVLN
jgi:DEAD/DEAH box helicase domain-containing protein